MNVKLSIICFILLLFLIIGGVSAQDNDNETLPISKDLDSQDVIKIENKTPDEIVSKNVESNSIVETTNKNVSSSILTPVVAKLAVNILAPNIKMHYKDGTKFKITLKDAKKTLLKNTKVKIQINGQTYTKITDKEGSAYLNLNLKSGTYKVLTTFAGNKYYYNKSVSSTVEVKSTIKCGDMTKFYKNNLAYSSTFYDSKGKILKNTVIKFSLNKKTFSVKTNVNGVAKLAIDLKPGKYSISISNPKTSESISKTVTINSLIQTKDITMTAKDGSKYSVKLFKSNGKAAPYTSFKVNLNGKVYYEKTNKNGVATIKLDLNAGKYSISVHYQGLTNVNKIIVNKITNILNYLNPLKKVTAKTSVKSAVISDNLVSPNDLNNNQYLLHNLDLAFKNQMNSKTTLIS